MAKAAVNGQEQDLKLVSRTCCVCGSSNHSLAYDQPTENITGIGDIGYHHLINVCEDCGFVFASPILHESVIQKYYEQMSNYEHPESEGARPQTDVNQIVRQIELITSRFPSGFKGNALDVGCSIAYGLSLLQQNGWQVLGLDPSDKCIDISKDKLGVTVRKGFFSLELLRDTQPFDVIILSHVVEHLVSPEILIRQLGELISENGVVYIEVPNLMKPNGTKCYFAFEHLNYFTPQSLSNLIRQNGFEVDRLETFDNGRHIHPFYPVIALTIRKSSKSPIITNDKSAALAVIDEYKRTTGVLMQKMNTRIREVVEKTSTGRLALWGAGIHTSQLLSETVLRPSNLTCIFDNDPKKAGSKVSGIEIRKFPASGAEAKKDIDAILISSEASEEEIYRQIEHLQKHGIAVYRLYGP